MANSRIGTKRAGEFYRPSLTGNIVKSRYIFQLLDSSFTTVVQYREHKILGWRKKKNWKRPYTAFIQQNRSIAFFHGPQFSDSRLKVPYAFLNFFGKRTLKIREFHCDSLRCEPQCDGKKKKEHSWSVALNKYNIGHERGQDSIATYFLRKENCSLQLDPNAIWESKRPKY